MPSVSSRVGARSWMPASIAACRKRHKGVRWRRSLTAFGLHRADFDALIEGVEMDAQPRRYETFAELYEYCIRVASAVGLICLDIFGAATTASRTYATDLGVALQLTNILRDVPGDLARGRVYIPMEDFRAHGCTEADLQAEVAQAGSGIRSAAVKALLAHQGTRAREYYARAARALPPREARSLVAAEIMGAIYRAILRSIERRDYDVFREVVRIPAPAAGPHRCRGVGADDARIAAGACPPAPRPAHRDVIATS